MNNSVLEMIPTTKLGSVAQNRPDLTRLNWISNYDSK